MVLETLRSRNRLALGDTWTASAIVILPTARRDVDRTIHAFGWHPAVHAPVPLHTMDAVHDERIISKLRAFAPEAAREALGRAS